MLNDTTAAHFSIADKKTDIHVGIISIHTYHDGMHKELSYEVLPEYWGKGIAFAGAILILNYAKKDLELTEIYAETQCANLRSRKLLEKLGMKKKAELIRFNELQAVYSMLLIS
jgi:ribosomal-protein-alanine N-acetyltransferase